MNKVEIRPGVTIAYEDDWFGAPWTHPETVVMVHGNSESSRAWTCFVPHLAGTYRVIRLDMPGFGASSEPPPGYGWSAAELAADIARFLDALAIKRCHLIGAKVGGSTAMQLAGDQPQRFRSLCLFGSPVRGSGSSNADAIRAKGVRQWAAATMRARLGSAASQAQIEWWTELMGTTNVRAALAASSARIDMDLEDKLARITAPTLIVTTQESGLQSVAAVNRYAARIPDARVVVLPGDSYHIAAVAPDLCAQHALRFMQEATARGSRGDSAPPRALALG